MMADRGSAYWSRAGKGALSRRRLLASGALMAGGTALLAACGTKGNTSGGSTASKGGSTSGGSDAASAAIIGKEWNTSPGTPKSGGSLTWASTVPALANLDPILSASAMVHQMASNSYSKLMRVSRKNDDINTQVIYPDLATSWEITTPTTWTFHLRPGVKFQDVPPTNGRPLTAEDIKYSIMRSA